MPICVAETGNPQGPAILLIHGEADDNSGTFPVQSERFYAALKGAGANVRYVVLQEDIAQGQRVEAFELVEEARTI